MLPTQNEDFTDSLTRGVKCNECMSIAEVNSVWLIVPLWGYSRTGGTAADWGEKKKSRYRLALMWRQNKGKPHSRMASYTHVYSNVHLPDEQISEIGKLAVGHVFNCGEKGKRECRLALGKSIALVIWTSWRKCTKTPFCSQSLCHDCRSMNGQTRLAKCPMLCPI